LLAGVLYLAFRPSEPGTEKVLEKMTALTDETKQTDKEAGLAAKEAEPPARERTPEALQAAPVDFRLYEVKKGDTLWDIAESFTGNPFNYHVIAADSEIQNPDLIFPGQKVYIRIKEE
jgi:nucleoid-associated protein YgaU